MYRVVIDGDSCRRVQCGDVVSCGASTPMYGIFLYMYSPPLSLELVDTEIVSNTLVNSQNMKIGL